MMNHIFLTNCPQKLTKKTRNYRDFMLLDFLLWEALKRVLSVSEMHNFHTKTPFFFWISWSYKNRQRVSEAHAFRRDDASLFVRKYASQFSTFKITKFSVPKKALIGQEFLGSQRIIFFLISLFRLKPWYIAEQSKLATAGSVVSFEIRFTAT